MTSKRRALVVGIETALEAPRLPSASSDAIAIADLLEFHGEQVTPKENWQVTRLIEEGRDKPTYVYSHNVQQAITDLLISDDVDEHTELLFYFAGHGVPRPWGGELLAHNDLAMSFNDLMALVNQSRAEAITIILDCCLSGGVGNEGPGRQLVDFGADPFRPDRAVIREGLAILTASRRYEESLEVQRAGKRPVGAFTELLVSGLEGGASDLLGNITALDLYAYAAQGFDDSTQRPTFKSHVIKARPIRKVEPQIPRERLERIAEIFEDGRPKFLSVEHDYVPGLNGSKARTGDGANYVPFTGSPAQNHLDHIKLYRNMGLVTTTVPHRDFWDVCLNEESVELTGIGKYYWSLVDRGLLPPE